MTREAVVTPSTLAAKLPEMPRSTIASRINFVSFEMPERFYDPTYVGTLNETGIRAEFLLP